MATPEEIERFKRAFKASAKKANKDIRWEKAKLVWQTQTSLAPVAAAIETLLATPSKDNANAVLKRIDELPPDKATRYQKAIDDLKRDLEDVLVEEESLGGDIAFGKTYEDKAQIHGDGQVLGNDVSRQKADFVKNVITKLGEVEKRQGVKIDGIAKLVESVCKDPKMGATSSAVDGTIWEQAMKHLEDTVLPTVAKDLGKLAASGLVGKGATLQGVQFTGSDFHKGGKQVLFLRFLENGKEKKVVYKPSSLMVDSLLFGNDSVATTLGGISSYNIVPAKGDDDKDLGYGYMEFIDKGGSPTSAQDVIGIFVGVAENMALSYYVGLDDVHEENLIVKKNGVQVIDMEATTGVFNPVGTATTGAFYDQLWSKAIYQGVRPKLQELIKEGTLTALPDDAAVEQPMKARFAQVLTNMAKGSSKAALKKLEDTLAQQTTRTVPIATNAFQKDLIPKAQELKTLTKWREMLDADTEATKTLIKEAQGQTTTPPSTIKALLYTKGVFDALLRGDVPYYTRQLGSDKVCDEAGEEIAVPGYKKVGKPIHEAMKERREMDPKTAQDLFELQALKQVRDSLSSLRVELAVKQTTG